MSIVADTIHYCKYTMVCCHPLFDKMLLNDIILFSSLNMHLAFPYQKKETLDMD